MTFETTCPNCDRKIKARPEHEGKRLACPGCKQMFVVQKSAPAKSANPSTPPPPPPTPTPDVVDDYRLSDFGLDAPAPEVRKSLFDNLPPTPQKNSVEINEEVDLQNAAFANPYMGPAFATPAAKYSGDLPEFRKYPALNVIRIVLLVLAALIAFGWAIMVVGAIVAIVLTASRSAEAATGAAGISLIYLAGSFFSGAITICLLVAFSEMIKVVLDIQSNTLAAARR